MTQPPDEPLIDRTMRRARRLRERAEHLAIEHEADLQPLPAGLTQEVYALSREYEDVLRDIETMVRALQVAHDRPQCAIYNCTEHARVAIPFDRLPYAPPSSTLVCREHARTFHPEGGHA